MPIYVSVNATRSREVNAQVMLNKTLSYLAGSHKQIHIYHMPLLYKMAAQPTIATGCDVIQWSRDVTFKMDDNRCNIALFVS